MADDGSPMNGSRSKAIRPCWTRPSCMAARPTGSSRCRRPMRRTPALYPRAGGPSFADLGDDTSSAERNAEGATWKRSDWPRPALDEQVAAFDGNWALLEPKLEKKIKGAKPAASDEDVHRAVKDSIRAIMMIRAYRMRGHLAADLDPLGSQRAGRPSRARSDAATASPKSRFQTARSFLDKVLGPRFRHHPRRCWTS
jgi:2-oxoglutarate dehydrogenase E1 component